MVWAIMLPAVGVQVEVESPVMQAGSKPPSSPDSPVSNIIRSAVP